MESAQDRYIREHSTAESEALKWLVRQTNLRTNYPRMLSGGIQGELLKLIAEMLGARNILEIGCFTGYSSIWLAMGLKEGGKLDSLEINDELEDLIREGWNRAGVQNKIELHIGDALDTMERLFEEAQEYDLVYIDADKREYLSYYKSAKRLLRRGGVILADDTMLGGKVYDCPETSDKQTRGLLEFNDFVAADPEVEQVILPLRDGLSIIRKL
ncbi:MAG: O-methyltransferase [Candidatus Cryptobacteroides sp.]